MTCMPSQDMGYDCLHHNTDGSAVCSDEGQVCLLRPHPRACSAHTAAISTAPGQFEHSNRGMNGGCLAQSLLDNAKSACGPTDTYTNMQGITADNAAMSEAIASNSSPPIHQDGIIPSVFPLPMKHRHLSRARHGCLIVVPVP